MIFKFLFALCLILTTLQSLAGTGSGHFVGNGGEGFRIGGKIFVRDLYESGLHLEPYVGNQIDTRLESRLQNSHFSLVLKYLNVDSRILLRKLTDLDRLHPNLGHYVLSAVEFYQWKKVTTLLGKLNDTIPVLEIPEEDQFVVANRFMYSIRLANPPELPLWDLLSQEHKVALIIHEGLYSLVRPSCKDSECNQSPILARELVGAAFSEIRLQQGKLTKRFISAFNFPAWADKCESNFQAKAFWDEYQGRTFVSSTNLAELNEPLDIETRELFIERVCSSISAKKGGQFQLTLELRRLPYQIVSDFYITNQHPQMYLTLVDRPPVVHEQLSTELKPMDCKNILSLMLADWFDNDAVRYRTDRGPSSCQILRP